MKSNYLISLPFQILPVEKTVGRATKRGRSVGEIEKKSVGWVKKRHRLDKETRQVGQKNTVGGAKHYGSR